MPLEQSLTQRPRRGKGEVFKRNVQEVRVNIVAAQEGAGFRK
jgi:hypothetical protein